MAVAKATLQRIERELERIGLLLQHDAELPSVTLLAAGEPIRGSWWADPRCHDLYDLMQELEHDHDVLTAKVVNGKVTYVHPRLWPAFLAVAQNSAPDRLRGLSPIALRLHERVAAQGPLRADDLRRSGFASTAELTKAIRHLELKLLVHTDDIHTESGAHAKVLQTWQCWAGRRGVRGVRGVNMPLPQAIAELERSVQTLAHGARRRPKLPW